MFNPEIVARIARQHHDGLRLLVNLENHLKDRFYDLETPIGALVLAMAMGEPLLFSGPPGAAKGRLIRAVAGFLDLLNEDDLAEDHEGYFETLLTPFSEPGDLWGQYNPAEAIQGNLVRFEQPMMQDAVIVYLDELFRGSNAILSSIHPFLEERIFHDRGKRTRIKMEYFFAATNSIPESSDFDAILDRLVLRCRIDNVQANPGHVAGLLKAGWQETHGDRPPRPAGAPDLLQHMRDLRKTIGDFTKSRELLTEAVDEGFASALADMIHHCRSYELSQMSNRRLIKISYAMLVHRMYRAVLEKEPPEKLSLENKELLLVPDFFLDRYDDETAINDLKDIASSAKL